MRSDTLEAVEGRLLFCVAPEHADVHARVPEIRAHLGGRNSYEPDNAWVLGRFCEEGGYLDADRFGDAVRSTSVTQKRPPLKSVCARPVPCDSTRARHLP